MMIRYEGMLMGCLLTLVVSCTSTEETSWSDGPGLRAVNESELVRGTGHWAIENVAMVDVLAGEIIAPATIIVQDTLITYAGPSDGAPTLTAGAERIDATGSYAAPGLIDAHFHLNNKLLITFLQKGITTIRDPGAWIESYNNVRASGESIPRLFLTGPHFDMENPAYPNNCVIIRDPAEARLNVRTFVGQGASAIKIYFRSSLEIIEETCRTAHAMGVPVTAHLEMTDIYQALDYGLDGIEHITSLGTNLVPKRQAEDYKRALLIDNNARRQGRYKMWRSIDFDHDRARKLTALLVDRQTFVCPTLGAFEYRAEDGKELDSVKLEGFAAMLAYTGALYRAGANLVMGSHSWTPYDAFGHAYYNEMDLWAQTGMDPLYILRASTIENARFLRVENRLGTLEAGKLADLIILQENPLADIRAIRSITKVMLHGTWVATPSDH